MQDFEIFLIVQHFNIVIPHYFVTDVQMNEEMTESSRSVMLQEQETARQVAALKIANLTEQRVRYSSSWDIVVIV